MCNKSVAMNFFYDIIIVYLYFMVEVIGYRKDALQRLN